MNLTERYEPINAVQDLLSLDFDYSEKVLSKERQKAKDYVANAIKNIKA